MVMDYYVYKNDKLDFEDQGSVICLGNFDGVHLGHQLLLETAKSIAKTNNLQSVFFTMFPSPKFVLGLREEQHLTSLDDRYNLIKENDIDGMIVLPFNLEIAKLDYKGFLEQIVMKLNPKYIVCGQDYNFGYKGEGKITNLIEYGKGKYEVIVVEDVIIDDIKVSTTKVIESLKEREIEKVNKYLGRNYAVNGVVIKGHGNGKKIGFPTANIDSNNYFLPASGVYAVNVYYKGKKYAGMANIGTHPTIAKLSQPILEIHIFDFENDIYGETLKIEFCAFIRLEKHFAKLDLLVKQLEKDKNTIKGLQF